MPKTDPVLRIHLFGNLRVTFAERPVTAVNTNRLQSLLAYLILHGDAPQPRERLAFTLWPESRESQARTNLRQLLHNLKRALPAECSSLVVDYFAVQWLRDGSCVVDTFEFRQAIADSATAREKGDRAGETETLTAAAALYEDDLLPSLYDDWVTVLRDEYRRQMVETLLRLATLFEEQRDYRAGIAWANRLVALDPLSEPAYQVLIRLHDANDDRAGALRAYHQCMRVLRREMGVEPGAATKELFERILKEIHPGSAVKPVPQLRKARTLIGRADEWTRLLSAWASAAAGVPQVAVISGEPGIGKTRLADELCQSCVQQGYAVARSRCYTGQGQAPFAPIAEWLRCDSVRAGWKSLRPQYLTQLARLTPEIREEFPDLEMEPGPLAESWQRLHFYESLSSAFARSRKPMLLFLDDIQWCDADSLEWLAAFLKSSASGVLLLATARDEDTGDHPWTQFLAGLRRMGILVEIPLDPLDAGETAELARTESAKPLDSADLTEIFRATNGNPLFIVESVRAGRQSTRVHAVIAARLAQLPPESSELAGLASVIGTPFSFELLEKATDWDEGSVSQALEELWRRNIVESRGASEYDFTHDRLREVACAELSLVRRRYLHRRIARALGEVHQGDIEVWSGQIASHCEQAGMMEESIGHYWKAAEHARRRYADKEAAELLRRALALRRGLPESERTLTQELDLLVMLGAALVTTEGYSTAAVGETFERALDLSRQLNDRNIFLILGGSWVFHVVKGDLEEAHRQAVEFLKRAEQDGTTALIRTGNFLVGTCLFHLGQLEEALDRMSMASLDYSSPSESVLALFAGPDIGVFCRAYLGHLAWHRNAEGGGEDHAVRAIDAARRIRHPFSEAIALAYSAMLYVFRRDSRAALQRGREAVELCRRHGFTYYLAMANVITGWALAAEEDPSAGLTQLRSGLEEMRALGAEIRLPYYYALLADALARASQPGEALASVSTGLAFAGTNHEEWPVAELHRVQGDLLASEGKSEAAIVCYRHALDAARRVGSVAFEHRLSGLAGGTAAAAVSERF